MQARRPTRQETIRVHAALTQLVPHMLPVPSEIQPNAPPVPSEVQPRSQADLSPPIQSQTLDCPSNEQVRQQISSVHEHCQIEPVESDAQLMRADEDSEVWKSLVVACTKSQLPRLRTAAAQGDSALHCIRGDGCTLLHIAAAAGSWRVVDLLIDAGVSPAPRDRRRKSAYDVSKDKATRDSFRKGM
jgi:hypothetical protein